MKGKIVMPMKKALKIVKICLFGLFLLQAFASHGQPVTKISAGQFNSFFIRGGALWGTGHNAEGELGDGTLHTTNRLEQIVASGVTEISTGGGQTLFIKSDGSLWAMGYNAYGGLGDGTWNNTNRPEQIVAGNVTAIATADLHSAFIGLYGSLWDMGANDLGELGDGTYSTNSPYYGVNVPELSLHARHVTAIAAGGYHTLFLERDGSLWGMGENAKGELGDGTYNPNFHLGINLPELIVSNGVTAIAAGFNHSLFLKSDGSLWAMGDHRYGQLGLGAGYAAYPRPVQVVTNGVIAIAAGYYHSLYLKSDGSLWAMGNNAYGQL
ncbi:MAG: repeat-containing protein, partial [Pedosphaera sp.]|nr:repeat-containing protein [Pedosphaera sp.]